MVPTDDVLDVSALEARVRELEAENARLVGGTPAARPARRGRWRAVLSTVLIVIAAVLVPVSIVAAWARVILVDQDQFVATLAPLSSEVAVQDLLIDESMSAISDTVDFAELTGRVFDGFEDLGIPPRAADALDLLRGPAASGVEGLVARGVTDVVRSDAFTDVWAATLRGAHRALTTTATSDGGGIIVQTGDGLGIQLGEVVARVQTRLVDQGVGIAGLIPAVDRVVIIGTGENVALLRTVYALAVGVGWWLPVVSLALFVAGILVARRRSTAVLGSGIGLTIGAGALAAALGIGASAAGIVAVDAGISGAAIDVIYAQLVESMTRTAWVCALAGVVIAIVGWVSGGSTAANRTRAFTDGVNGSARRRLNALGLHTGRFGEWLGRSRALVRGIVIALAVVWLLALRPLTPGLVFTVVVVALVVGWLLELAQRRPEELDGVSTADDAGAAPESADADQEYPRGVGSADVTR